MDRHFRPVHFHHGVVDAGPGEGGHDMLDGADPRVRLAGQAENGTQPRVHDIVEASRDVDAEIGAAEHDAAARRGRQQSQTHAFARMQPDAHAIDGRFQCALDSHRILQPGNLRQTVHEPRLPCRRWLRGKWRLAPPNGFRQSTIIAEYFSITG